MKLKNFGMRGPSYACCNGWLKKYSKWLQSAETKGGVEKREKKTITKRQDEKRNRKERRDNKQLTKD